MKIGLINIKSKTMTPHLLSLGNAIKAEYPDGVISSFIENFGPLSAAEKEKKEKELQAYINELDVICCINNSLPATLTFKENQRRILYAMPYDYLFKYYIADREWAIGPYAELPELSCFTEIHYFSDTQKELLKKLCPQNKAAFQPAVHYCYASRSPLSVLFESIRGKKIIGLFTVTGTKVYDCGIDFSELFDFVKTLPDDYVVVTNNSLFFEQAKGLPLHFADSFLYVPPSVRNVYEMLEETDILLTDYAAFLCSFQKEKKTKPFWILPYKKSKFLEYALLTAPDLLLTSMEDLSLQKLCTFTDTHKAFMEKL